MEKLIRIENFRRNVDFKKIQTNDKNEYIFESQDVLIVFENRFLKSKLQICFDESFDESDKNAFYLSECWYSYDDDEIIDEIDFRSNPIKSWMHLPEIDSDEWINVADKMPYRNSPLDLDDSDKYGTGGTQCLVKISKENEEKIVIAFYDYDYDILDANGCAIDCWRSWEEDRIHDKATLEKDIQHYGNPEEMWIVTHWMPLITPPENELIKKLKTPIAKLFSMRTYMSLRCAKIDTLSQLVQYEQYELMRLKGFGKKALSEVDMVLHERGLNFGMDISKLLNKEEI